MAQESHRLKVIGIIVSLLGLILGAVQFGYDYLKPDPDANINIYVGDEPYSEADQTGVENKPNEFSESNESNQSNDSLDHILSGLEITNPD